MNAYGPLLLAALSLVLHAAAQPAEPAPPAPPRAPNAILDELAATRKSYLQLHRTVLEREADLRRTQATLQQRLERLDTEIEACYARIRSLQERKEAAFRDADPSLNHLYRKRDLLQERTQALRNELRQAAPPPHQPLTSPEDENERNEPK